MGDQLKMKQGVSLNTKRAAIFPEIPKDPKAFTESMSSFINFSPITMRKVVALLLILTSCTSDRGKIGDKTIIFEGNKYVLKEALKDKVKGDDFLYSLDKDKTVEIYFRNWSNGKPQSRLTFKNGLKDGLYLLYGEDGKLIGKRVYENDVLIEEQ